MKVKVLLFGMLADEVRKSMIEIENVSDTNSLLINIQGSYPAFKNYKFIIAKNKKIISGNQPVNESDTIALLPPFSGG